MTQKTPKQLGNEFEHRVMTILMKHRYSLINKNQWVKNYKPEKDHAKKREFDIVMYNTRIDQFYVIECKAHFSKTKKVTLDQVVKLDRVSRDYGAVGAVKLIATDTDLEDRAKEYAKKHNIKYLNGEQLDVLEEHPSRSFGSASSYFVRKGIEKLILDKDYEFNERFDY